MAKKIYISKSVKILDSGSYFLDALTYLDNMNINYDYWRQNTQYKDHQLLKSDAVVILIEGATYIGKGSYSEIMKAQEYEKDIYIMYRRKTDDTWHFYSLDVDYVDYTYNNTSDYNKYADIDFGRNITNEVVNKYKENLSSWGEVTLLEPLGLTSAYTSDLTIGSGILVSNEVRLNITFSHLFAEKDYVIKDYDLLLLL